MRKYELLILLFTGSIIVQNRTLAQEKQDASIDINLGIVSNYIWRGSDLLRNYALLNQIPYSSFINAWAFQPSITWNTPVEGLFINLFGSFAIVDRKDIDIDKRLQQSPGDPFIAGRTTFFDYLLNPSLDIIADINSALPTTGNIIDYQNVPNFYKEKTGLQRNDELDITIGYEKETSKGIIGFGILQYSYANHLRKNSVNLTDVYGSEVYISYAFPELTALKFTIYYDVLLFTNYYQISYSGEYELTQSLNSSYNISTGYYVLNNVQGVSDVTLNYTLSHNSGVYLGINIAYRPDIKIQEWYWGSGDAVTAEAFNTKLPIELNGSSNIYDGLVADPSKNLGPVNEHINKLISSQISSLLGIPYTYTPRQKLPKYVWWLSLGYSISL